MAVVVADGRGSILFRSAAAESMLPSGETLEAAFATAHIEPALAGWEAAIAAVIARQTTVQWRARFGPTGGVGRTLSIRCLPMRLTPTNPAAAVLLLQEVDGPVTDEEQVDVSRRLASLGKLAARVAHELNNPLDGILRYINLALRIASDAPEPRLQSYLAESRTGLMRMVQIIGDLLEFSRTSDDGFGDRSVNEVIEEAIRANAGAADRNHVVVAGDFQSCQMPKVRGSRLYQVCCNLIRNAIDAMPEGGRLTISSGLVDGDVVIRVADTGVGLPEPIEKIFEPFFTTKQPGKGTGLGLAISKDFIEDMGGTIAAAQGEERGAVFTVRVPAAGIAGAVRLLQVEKREMRNQK